MEGFELVQQQGERNVTGGNAVEQRLLHLSGGGRAGLVHQADIAQAAVQNAGQASRIVVRFIQVAPQHPSSLGQAALTVLLQQGGLAEASSGADQDQAHAFALFDPGKQGSAFQLARHARRHEEFARANGQPYSLYWFVGTMLKTFHASYLWSSSCRCRPF
ncbi:hypothetical protein D3C80_1032250 [compost metagenome]